MACRQGTAIWIVVLCASSLCEADAGDDEGFLFVGPREVKRTKRIKKGTHIVAYHRRGVSVSERADSPWNQAALFIQGTSIEDAQGKILQDVALCEATDADGDLNWSTLWRAGGTTGTVAFKLGTGKWRGIRGVGVTRGMLRGRSDDHYMLKSEMFWNIDP